MWKYQCIAIYLLCCTFIFGEGSPEKNNVGYKKYIMDKPQGYRDLGHGLFEIQEYQSGNNRPRTLYGTWFYYNEAYNSDIQSPVKLNEITRIAYVGGDNKYTIDKRGDRIEIIMPYESYPPDSDFVLLVFDDTTHRLSKIKSSYSYRFWDFGSHDKELSYTYDPNGRLSTIHAVYDFGTVLRKEYCYDGNPRRLFRPYFLANHIANLEEIVVYDNDTLKYVTKLYAGPGGVKELTMEEEERNHHFTVTEYGKDFKIVRATRYYEGQDLYSANDPIVGEPFVFFNE